MASLILAAGALTYDKVQKSREKKRARKDNNSLRYSELEKDHAEHLGRRQSGREVCYCEWDGWDGKTHRGGCARARLMGNGDKRRELMGGGDEDNTAGLVEKAQKERSNVAPPTYEISEKECKGKRGIFFGGGHIRMNRS